MKELLRTNDAVRLSFLQSLLKDSGIESLVLDHYTSVVEGSIGAIPRRLMVAEQDYRHACSVLVEAGEAAQDRPQITHPQRSFLVESAPFSVIAYLAGRDGIL